MGSYVTVCPDLYRRYDTIYMVEYFFCFSGSLMRVADTDRMSDD